MLQDTLWDKQNTACGRSSFSVSQVQTEQGEETNQVESANSVDAL